MNNKDNKLIFEQYTNPRNANKRQSITIVEALDHVMRLPRVERHGKTLVSEADLVDVLRKLQAAGLGSGEPNSDETEAKLQAYRDNGMWPADDDGRWNTHAGKYPKKSPGQSQDEQPADEQPADEQPADEQPEDGQAKLDADVVTKLQKATDENGQINILDALTIIGAFQEDE